VKAAAAPLTKDELQRVTKRDQSTAFRSLNSIVICVYLVLGALQHGQHHFASFTTIACSFISLATMFVFSVVLHEIGHAAVAHLVKFQPFAITVGSGPALLIRNAFGLTWRIGVIPGGGMAMFSTPASLRRIKWRLLLTLAAGPLVTGALLLTGLYLIPYDWDALKAGTDTWIRPGAAMVIINGVLLITTALPTSTNRPGAIQSDLVRIVMLPWMSPAGIEQLAQSEKVARVARLFVLQDYRGLFEEAERQLQADPSSWGVRITIASMLDNAGRFEEAADQYRLILANGWLPEGKVGDPLRALVSNNLAWELYLMDDPNQLDEAEQTAKDALALHSGVRAYLGTYGAILIERGQLDEGRALVERSLSRLFGAIPVAFSYAILAMASARGGNVNRARQLLKKARRRDPENPLLPRVERELIAAQSRSASSSAPAHVS
jgi:Zn-dependent protease/Tfp pilus assembly protein PilF